MTLFGGCPVRSEDPREWYERTVRDAASRLDRVRDAGQELAKTFEDVERAIRDIIRELVEWLIAEWIIAQLLAPETWGGSEAAFIAVEAPATASVALVRAISVLNKLRKALWEFCHLYKALKAGSFAEKFAAWLIKKEVKGLVNTVTGLNTSKFAPAKTSVGDAFQHVVEVAAEEFDDRRSGVDGDDDWLRRKASAVVDPIADALDPVLDHVDKYVDPISPYVEKANDVIPD